MPAPAGRQLLFGLLALQNGLINQVQLVAAFQAWTLDKARSLAVKPIRSRPHFQAPIMDRSMLVEPFAR
jgi:hypothetical protein